MRIIRDTIYLRLDVLIEYLSYLFQPIDILVGKNPFHPQCINISDDKQAHLMEYLIYDMNKGAILETSASWHSYINDFVNERVSDKNSVNFYNSFIEEHPEFCRIIPPEKWFLKNRVEDKDKDKEKNQGDKKQWLLPPFKNSPINSINSINLVRQIDQEEEELIQSLKDEMLDGIG